jgi:hypothetical protein
LEEWRKSNPGERIDDLTIIRERSLVIRLEVEHSPIISDEPLLSFDLVEPIVKKYGMEYMEALMHDAAGYYLSRQVKSPVIAMLSRRQIAIVVYQSKSRGYILDMELFLTTLDPDMATLVREGFEAWASGDEQGYLVHKLPNDYRPGFVGEDLS